jgi:hybrid cluster-associated redox disulfide protein
MQFTADTNIHETIRSAPGTVKVYQKYNLRCPGCSAKKWDTVRDISRNYGVNLDDFLRDLNEAANVEG